MTKMAGVFSRFSIKIIYIKINHFACDLRTHTFRKTDTREFFRKTSNALVLRTGAILVVFEKLTRACF